MALVASIKPARSSICTQSNSLIIITRMHYVQWPRGATCIAYCIVIHTYQVATAQERDISVNLEICFGRTLPKPVRKKEIFLNVAPSTAPTQNPVSPTTGDNAVKSD